MSLHIEINRKMVISTVQETFVGVGIGALAGHAVRLLVPAARMAAPAGMVFGALFSLSRIIRIIDTVVEAFFGKMLQLFNIDPDEMGGITTFALGFSLIGSIYLVRGALAFGVTALLLPGFTLYSGLALTAVIGAIDVISVLALGKAWMFDKK